MSLKDFLQQNKPSSRIIGDGSLSQFLQDREDVSINVIDRLNTPGVNVISEPIKIEPKESKIKDTFRFIGKQFQKSIGVTALELKGVTEYTTHLLSIASPRISASQGLKAAGNAWGKSQQDILDVLVGKKVTSFSKELIKSDDATRLEKALAIGADFVLDPLWVTKPIKLVKAGAKITKLDKPLKTLADVIKKTPVAKRLKSLFSNLTGNKEFDDIVKKFRSLKEYRETNLIDDAVKLQKDIKGYEKLGIKNIEEIITEGLENPKTLANIKDEKLLNIITNLRNTYRDLLSQSRKVGLTIGEIENYAPHIKTTESFINSLKKQFGIGIKEWGTANISARRKLEGTMKQLIDGGIDIFEKNPAIQLVKKGQAYAKAITAKEFTSAVEKFALKTGGVEVTNPLLKGLKFVPEQAKVIDNYYQGIQPDEVKVVLQSFDKVQNWWKAQALISPSYHMRNTVGNLWNNFLANVGPQYYFEAGLLQKNPTRNLALIDEMKQLNVIGRGWYAKDIGEEVLQRVQGVKNVKAGLNPIAQQNYLFQLNKNIGTTIENNARIAHYLSKKATGMTPAQAAESVKKYLFDYGDLTSFEQKVMKRLIPFYTWTRKNLPIQLEGLVTQPGKYVLPHKIVERLEAGVEMPNESYMSPYITENTPVRIRTNPDGNTEYFLLGNWLPYAAALDVLSSPLENMVNMLTPFIKTPYEVLANESTFFKNTLNENNELESRYKKQGEFLGQSMRKRNIMLLRNIRILGDINKWIDKQDPRRTKDTWVVKLLETLFGKAATYNVSQSKYFYDLDTNTRISDLKRAIKDAEIRQDPKQADKLRTELLEFRDSRNIED